jgi:hypothetical protein
VTAFSGITLSANRRRMLLADAGKIRMISEQQPWLSLPPGFELSATLARVKNARIAKIAGLSFAGAFFGTLVGRRGLFLPVYGEQ